RANREHERREAVERVLDREIRALVEQDLDDVDVAGVAGVENGGGVVAELRIDVDPLVEQRLHHGGVALAGGVLELLGLRGRRRLPERERGGGDENDRLHGVLYLRMANKCRSPRM